MRTKESRWKLQLDFNLKPRFSPPSRGVGSMFPHESKDELITRKG